MSWADEIANVQAEVLNSFRESEPVVIYPVEDPWTPVEVPGIFDNDATFLLFGEEITYTSSGPLLGIRDSDHQGKRGDEVELRGSRYRAVDLRPDGHGFTVLVLEAV